MIKKVYKIEAIFLISALINVLFFISNICSYYILFNYRDGSIIPMRYSVIFEVLFLVEIIAFILSTGNLNKEGTPYTKRYINKYRIIFACYIVLIGFRLISLKISLKNINLSKLYIVLWGILFFITVILHIQICRNFFNLCKHGKNKIEELEKEYVLELNQDELIIFSKIRRFFVLFLIVTLITICFYDLIMKNIIFLSAYIFIYTFFLITKLKNIFQFYYHKFYILITVSNSIIANIGCILVWLINKDYIILNIYKFNDLSLSELYVIQLLFLSPFFLWVNKKYKRYQRYNYFKIINERNKDE